MKVHLSREAKAKILTDIIKRALVKYQLEDKILSKEVDTNPVRIGIRKIRRWENKGLFGRKETKKEFRDIVHIYLRVSEVKGIQDYGSLMYDSYWNPVTVKSVKKEYDDPAYFIAKELDSLGIKVSLVINDPKKMQKLNKEGLNPSRR